MAGWRSSWRRAGLLGIAIATALGLAACGTASGQTRAAGDVSTTTAVHPTGPTTTSGRASAGPTTTTGSGRDASSTSGPRGAASEPEEPAASAKLRLGDHGKGVAALQRPLAALGYEVHKADGQFGSATHHAVVAFQKVNRLDRDGVTGPE